MMPARAPAPAAGADWKLQPERSNLYWLRAMTWLSLRLGRGPSRVILYAIAAYFLAFAPTARRASVDYLRRVLALPSRSAVGWRHRFAHFVSFASVIHDRIYLINERFDLFDIRVRNQALIDDLMADGAGVFLIGAHLGSFEVLRAFGRRRTGLRIAMAMYEDNARMINTALSAINPNARQDIIALGHIDSMMQVHDMLARGHVVGMLGDRLLANDDTHAIPFLGETAQLPLGPFRLAAIMHRPVLFMTGIYRGGNRYDIGFELLADFSTLTKRNRSLAVRDAMTRYAALLEQQCRQAPYNWFNFFDFWRTASAPQPAPRTR